MIPVHKTRARQLYLQGFPRDTEVHAASPHASVATLAMTPPEMILLYQAQAASRWQTCIFLLALICLFSLHRDPSHLRKHIRLISIGVSTLEELLRGYSLLLD